MNQDKLVAKLDLDDDYYGCIITMNYYGDPLADGRYQYNYTFELWEICPCEERNCPHKGDLLDISYSETITSPRPYATLNHVVSTVIAFSSLKREDTDIDLSYLPQSLLKWNEEEGAACWTLQAIGDCLDGQSGELNIWKRENVYDNVTEHIFDIELRHHAKFGSTLFPFTP